jgi:hypothetical protein
VKLALDENLPPALAHAINALLAPSGGQAISIPERCGRGVSDREWIEALQAEGGWAVLTFDRKLRTRPARTTRAGQSGLVVFILAHGWNQAGYWAMAAGVIRWLPHMMDAIAKHQPAVLLVVPYRWTPTPISPFKR